MTSDVNPDVTPDVPTPDLSRRGVLRGVTVGGLALPLLVACGEDPASGPATATGNASTAGGSASGSSSGSGGTSAEGPRVATSDVPVGGGTILTDDAGVYVVTQPTEGEFKAFSGICTHQKCPVTEITGGEIVCNCHGSHYAVADGSVVSGPAPAPLAELDVTVEGGEVLVSG